MMEIISTQQELKKHLKPYVLDPKKSIGLVPTMGALHAGHLSLVQASKENNDVTVVSIFVNPTQFDNIDDLKKYPKTLDEDVKLLQKQGCDVVFVPSVEEIYESNLRSEKFDFDGLEYEMEGKFREGHFDGVGTIVNKLFEIVTPDSAYFGQKDFQQLQIIKKMVEKLKIDVNVIGCPILRESNGLAMSSRNLRLSPTIKKEASFIYKTLLEAQKIYALVSVAEVQKFVEDEFAKQKFFELEYFTIADENTLQTITQKSTEQTPRAFIAVFAGEIRLIDNISLN